MAVEMQLTCERVVSIIAPVFRLKGGGGEQEGSLWGLKRFSLVLQEEGGGPSDEAALILHRKGFDCTLSNRNTGLLCATTQGKVRPATHMPAHTGTHVHTHTHK